MDKKKYIYIGILLFAGLVIYHSTKKIEMVEIIDPSGGKLAAVNGEANKKLPEFLQPPHRIAEGENYEPPLLKKSLTGINFKPRFDNR